MNTGEFSVCQFFPDDSYDYIRRGIGAEEAVKLAKDYSQRPAASIGIIRRIIITDGGDDIVFEWRFGKGVTFPPIAAQEKA